MAGNCPRQTETQGRQGAAFLTFAPTYAEHIFSGRYPLLRFAGERPHWFFASYCFGSGAAAQLFEDRTLKTDTLIPVSPWRQ